MSLRRTVVRKLHAATLAVCFTFTHTAASPAGFAIDFIGARSVGNATAGSSSAADAATIFFNPAGIVDLKRNEWMVGGDLFMLHDRFTNQGSTIFGGALPTPGTNGDEAIPTTFIPWIFGAHRVRHDLSVGIGVFAPFGLRTDYGPDFVGRYQNELTALTVIDVNPVIAWKPVDWLSVGAGLNIEYARVRLTQAIDFGSICVAQIGGPLCSGAFGLTPGRSDGRSELKGDDVALGYNVGVLVRPKAGSQLGVAYRSRIKHRFKDAEQKFTVPAGARAFLAAGGTPAALTGGNASTDLPLPARLSFGWTETLSGDRVKLMADATLTKWSTFQRTVVTPDDPVTGFPAVIEQRYEDAWRFAVGVDYRLNDPRWVVRSGVGFDQTPIPDRSVQAALPDRDRVYLSLGATFSDNSERWRFDVAYSYVNLLGKTPIDRSTSNGDTLRGTFNMGGHVFAAQVGYRY